MCPFGQRPRTVKQRHGHHQGRNQPFKTVNLSEQGLQFQCSDLVEEGDHFRFSLKLPGEGAEVNGMARAARVTRTADVHDVGASIVEIPFLDGQRLREFLAEHRDAQPVAAMASNEA